jgi:hypothetical protein
VPEGVYAIVYLNPNSVAHLSMALDYPNTFDLARASEDGRMYETLGGDIMIHGGAGSIGCLAIGDEAAEDLFVLAADAGFERAVVVMSPVDFRQRTLPRGYRPPAPWVPALYAQIRAELDGLPLPHRCRPRSQPTCADASPRWPSDTSTGIGARPLRAPRSPSG